MSYHEAEGKLVYRDECYYLVNPPAENQCQRTVAFRVSEYHIDLWLAGYGSCADHLDYLLDYIKRNHNHASVRVVGDDRPGMSIKEVQEFLRLGRFG